MGTAKRHITCLLLSVSILLLIVPVVPHHHHNNTPEAAICFQHDIPAESRCIHHHHQAENDPCCTSRCNTHIQLTSPARQVRQVQAELQDIVPLLAAWVFQHFFPETISDTHNLYHESLYARHIVHAQGLRAPPAIAVR